MDKDTKSKLTAFWNIMRGAVSSDDYITAMVLADEVKKRLQNQPGGETSEQTYAALLEAADSMGVKNPFWDKDHFFLIYRESKRFDTPDWEGAIARTAAASRTPVLSAALVNMYEERFSIKPHTVLIAEAEKFVPQLRRIVDENSGSQFVLTTQNPVYAKALERLFEGRGNTEILQTGIYRYEFISKRFDLIFSSPNFGGRTPADDQSFICREFDMAALENLSLHLNSGGRLVITLPGRITFASGKAGDLRQFIQTAYTIKEISELPTGAIESCGIKVCLLDIENSRPEDEDIIIRRYSSGDKKTRHAAAALKAADDTFVMPEELKEQGDWSIDRIFSQQDEEYLRFQNSDIRKGMIGNAAQIFRGKSVTRKDPSGNIGVVNISNIGAYDIDYAGLDHLQEEERKVFNYLLQEGDVLLPARGTSIRTAVFHEQPYPCIASSNLIVIRPDPKTLDSTYLKIFLDSPIGNKTISSAQQGTSVMNISYKDLKTLEVPLPPLEKQQASAKEYLEELAKYKESIAKAEKRWDEVLERLQEF